MDGLDIVSLLQNIPWVISHPWFLTILLPAIFWIVAHVWANINPPTETSNTIWKAVYPVINTLIAANYNKTKNLTAEPKGDK